MELAAVWRGLGTGNSADKEDGGGPKESGHFSGHSWPTIRERETEEIAGEEADTLDIGVVSL